MTASPLAARLLSRSAGLVRHRTTKAYVIGYPKTGNTWLRFMLGLYAQHAYHLAEQPLFDESNRFGVERPVGPLPTLRFTHQPLTWEHQRRDDLGFDDVVAPFRRKRVIILVRHPLDVLVSNFHQQVHRTTSTYVGDLPAFIEDEVFGLEKLLRFYDLWRANRDVPEDTHLLRYEDLKHDPAGCLRSLLGFLRVGAQPDAIEAAVRGAEFDAMRQVEGSDSPPVYRSSGHSIFASGDLAEPNARHVRRGVVGGYRDELPPALVARLEGRVAAVMSDWYRYDGTDL